MRLSRRAEAMAPSPTLAMDAQVKEMRRQGIDVIGFSVGEPDFDTPEHIRQAAVEAVERGYTRYTPAGGIPELKEAIRDKLAQVNGLTYTLDQIVVSVGAKHALYNAFQVLLDDGDEVIIPAPYWVSYADQVRLAGGRPVIVPTSEESGFKLTAEQLKQHLSHRTRALVLNSPCNPTGAVYGREELAALAEAVLSHPSCLIIADEIYEPFVYDGHEHVSIASLSPDVQARTLIINGVSKTYAMTGWRIGYAAGPKAVIKAMADLQSQSTSNPTSIAQWAAVAALRGPEEPVRKMVAAFLERRDIMLEGLRALPGVTVHQAAGAFYLFPRIDAVFGRTAGGQRIDTSADLAMQLLHRARVALVPGSAFGMEGYVRLSYATSTEQIRAGLERMAAFWRELG
ncbi:MAG: pyridoxal phosphate-dependent aminotransferase [Firmicutes bacterium]|nr:pyridoxal phosphate-dependent aminotransferase [Bacillota bacterium]